jgi:phosphopantothenoylcysteine decarboxylase/phosphopantothenate--cysteine ligase
MKNKNILVGISGGIAAYKAALFVRLLIKEGANVQVIMTEFAKKFIGPLTLATLSKNPVITEFFNPENGQWNSHVDIGIWADAFVIAPATANTLGKAANGIADNLLLTTYLSARCPVFWAPSMDLDMFKHPAVIANIEKLKSRGNYIIDAETGELASGLDGKGRMSEPENIVQQLKFFFNSDKKLSGKNVLITAGPTYEKIDPVRFIGNNSSGKMGFAIADEMEKNGANVTVISGPVNIKCQNPNIKIINIQTANEMFEQTKLLYPNCDIAVFAAAVADYTPEFPAENKLKKHSDKITLNLVPTVDIAKEAGKLKSQKQINIGFALETENEIFNAKEKIKNKNFDLIVLNSLNDKGAGFAHDTNKISIIDKNNNVINFELKSKVDVAKDICLKIIEIL